MESLARPCISTPHRAVFRFSAYTRGRDEPEQDRLSSCAGLDSAQETTAGHMAFFSLIHRVWLRDHSLQCLLKGPSEMQILRPPPETGSEHRSPSDLCAQRGWRRCRARVNEACQATTAGVHSSGLSAHFSLNAPMLSPTQHLPLCVMVSFMVSLPYP